MKPEPKFANEPILSDEEARQRIQTISRRSFLWGAAATGAGFAGWRWLYSRPTQDGIPWPFRRALEFNEGLSHAYFRDSRLAPVFPRKSVSTPMTNGDIGMSDDFSSDDWQLTVDGLESGKTLTLTLEDLKQLPHVESMITELKCIEGWSVVVEWAGVRLADFIAKYPPARDKEGRHPAFVALETPDGNYYVGLDWESAIHPQTLLCYEMNGLPLTDEHGAPLRLVIPVKYGIKNIKRIGTIRFTNDRPKDYWAEQGYDWYAGH